MREATVPLRIKFINATKNTRKAIMLHIAGPPASGKTTLCRMLMYVFKSKGIEYLHTTLTGFHNISYVYVIVLLKLFKFCKVVSQEDLEQIKLTRRNPYDLIPYAYIKRQLNLIYLLEIVSMYLKFATILIKAIIWRPKVVIIDEGLMNVMFNYITFFHSRKSTLWKSLLKHVLRILHHMNKHFTMVVMILMPDIDLCISRWIKRGDVPSLNIVKMHMYKYTTLFKTLYKVLQSITNNRVYVFTDNKEAFRFILKKLQEWGCRK